MSDSKVFLPGRGKAVRVWEVDVMEDDVLPVVAILTGFAMMCLSLCDFFSRQIKFHDKIGEIFAD